MKKYTADGLPIITRDLACKITEEYTSNPDEFRTIAMEVIRKEQPVMYETIKNLEGLGLDPYHSTLLIDNTLLFYMNLKDQAALNKE